MPQMMPLNWILMFMQLTMIISLIMVIMFFLITPTPPSQQLPPHSTHTSWKW